MPARSSQGVPTRSVPVYLSFRQPLWQTFISQVYSIMYVYTITDQLVFLKKKKKKSEAEMLKYQLP